MVPKRIYKKKKKVDPQIKFRKVEPLPDKPNSYLVEHEVHDVPEPPPLHVPLPAEPLQLNKKYDPVVEAPHKTWAAWWKSLWPK